MVLITEELKSAIESIIRNIELQYRHNQGLILTEDDLKCLIYEGLHYLFLRRRKPGNFNSFRYRRQYNVQPIIPLDNFPDWRCPTLDHGIIASPVHTEIPWFDKDGHLSIRPDITILEPGQLSILHGLNGPTLPSKQFEFSGQGIIFEIKFNRLKSGITRIFHRSILNDFEKIQGLFEKLRHQGIEHSLFCYFIIFNKSDKKCREFRTFLNQHLTGQNFKFIYGTGLVGSPPSQNYSKIRHL